MNEVKFFLNIICKVCKLCKIYNFFLCQSKFLSSLSLSSFFSNIHFINWPCIQFQKVWPIREGVREKLGYGDTLAYK